MVRKIGFGVPHWGAGVRRPSTGVVTPHGVIGTTISATTFSDAAGIGTVIGNLSSTDYDAGVTYTYAIPSGGNPSGYFGLSGNQVNMAQGNIPDGTYSLTIRATDSNGRTHDTTFSLTSQTVYGAEATALFAQMSVQPTATRKGQIDTCINSLKTHGLWTMLDLFYMTAAHDQQASTLNWVNPGTNTLVAAGSPTFTIDQGWTGASTTGKLDTGFNPTSAVGRKLSQNDCSVHAYVKTNTTTTQRVVGNVGLGVNARTSSKGSLEVASATVNYAGSTSDYQGFFQGRRTDSANASAWLNLGASGAATATASIALANTTLNVCGGGSNSTTNASLHQVRFFAVGRGMTDQQITDFYNDVNTFITAIGANLTTGL